MKVILEPATGAVMMGKDEQGKEVRIKSVSVTPFFTTERGVAQVLVGKSVTTAGKAVDRFGITANGGNGKVNKGPRPSTKSVTPFIDKKSEEAPSNG